MTASPKQVSLFAVKWQPRKDQPLPWEIRQKLYKPKGGRNKKGDFDNFHNRDYDFVSPSGEIFTGKGVRQFALLHRLHETCLYALLDGRVHSHKGWTKAIGGRKLPVAPTCYFLSPSGEIHTTTNLSEFARQHSLDPIALSRISRCLRAIHRGWRHCTPDGQPIAPPDIKHRKFKLLSPTGEIIEGSNLKAFAEKHGLSRTCLMKVLDGTTKEHRGWKIPTDGTMTTTAPNLGKLFTSRTSRPATPEDIKILSPGDWISERQCSWSWQFRNFCQDMTVGVWEGKEFFIPTNLLMVCTVIEGNAVEKFLEPSSKFKVGDRVRDTFCDTYRDRLKGRLERNGIVLELCKEWAIVRWDCQPESHVGGCQWSYKHLEIEKLILPKPVLLPDAPIAVVLFSGGGGVEAGMVEAGIRPLIAVEFDPKKPKLSNAIADCHERNFGEYGCQVIRKTVQEISKLRFPAEPHTTDFLHASPMCSNFSNAKAGEAIETAEDIEMATAVADAIRYLKPKFFTLENVLRYRDSQSFKIIASCLEEEGYLWHGEVITLLDCQARKRFILRAAKGWLPPPPSPIQPVGWYEVVADLIPKMADSELVAGQEESLIKFLASNEPTPLLIERTGVRGEYKVKPAHKPCNTLLRSVFTDGKGSSRKFADIWLPGGTIKSVSIEAAARLQGFPDWYEFPPDAATAGSIIGYSVPPKFAAQLFKSLQQPPPTEIQIQQCQERIIKHNWQIQNLNVLPQTKDVKEAIKLAKGAIALEDQQINQLLEDLIIYRQFLALGCDRDRAKTETLKLYQTFKSNL